jgi:hypothetical protein
MNIIHFQSFFAARALTRTFCKKKSRAEGTAACADSIPLPLHSVRRSLPCLLPAPHPARSRWDSDLHSIPLTLFATFRFGAESQRLLLPAYLLT